LSAAAPELAGRTVIVDKARFPRDKICAGAIGGRAQRALAEIGVDITVPAVSIQALSVATRSGARRYVMPGGEAIGSVVRRRAYDAALLDCAEGRGVVVRQDTRVTGIERCGEEIALHTSAGSLTASVIVGADGVASYVRRWLGLPRGQLYAQAVEVDTPAHPSDVPRDTLHFDLCASDMRGYAWDFPTCVDGKPLVCRGVYELVRGAGKVSAIDVSQRLADRLLALGFDPARYRFKRFAERGLTLHEAYAANRVMLAGEAAGIDPVLGEGIAQAILYGQAAGRYLAEAVRRDDVSPKGYTEAIRRSRVGLDLSIRGRVPRMLYGPGRRLAEHWLHASPSLARAGMHYFAGKHVPRLALGRAAIDLLTSLVATGLRR
jgi:flavin-dependent dehydrogenase